MAHTFALSPAQRFQLAQIFLSKDLKLTGLAEQKQFNRTRLALRLSPIMDALTEGRPLNENRILNRTPSVFELSDEGVEFLLGKIAPLPLLGVQAQILGDFLEAVETAKLIGQAPPVLDADPLAVEADALLWSGDEKPAGLKAV